MRMRFFVLSLVAFGTLLAALPAQAGLIFVTSRGALGGTDFIDWGQLGPDLTIVSNPAAVTSNGGISVSVSIPSGSMERRDQGSGWGGVFAAGDKLLWTRNQPGPITLNFGSLIAGGGAQVQQDLFGPYTGRIEAFDSGGVSLGAFTLAGISNSNGDNSAIFVGVLSDAVDIARIDIGLTNSEDFAINQFDIVTAGDGHGGGDNNQIPEPGTLTILGFGLAGLGLVRRRRRV